MSFIQELSKLEQPTWKEVQRLLILVTLERFRWNKSHAAKALGISVRTMRNKCKKFQLERP